MAEQNARSLFGSTNDSSSVPDASLARLIGDHLADALVVWECYRDEPLEHTPLVLRFGACDLVVSTANGDTLALRLGSVDTTQTPEIAAPACEELCPAWMPADALADALGQRVMGVAIQKAICELTLEDCRIRLAARGSAVEIRVESAKG